ncbi:MAG TPA: transporter associated domain-containing protein [Arenicellales bacterium]|nr:transporter associated domain-containing protein [Arenicellales bacterium]
MNNNDEPPSTSWWAALWRRLRRCLGGSPGTREEVLEFVTKARGAGLLDQETQDTIQRVLQVAELRVRDIMIPRSKMVVVDRSDTPEQFLPVLIDSAHSRFPVVDGERDKVIGILLAKDVLRYFHDGESGSFNMRDMLRPVVFIPESKRLNVLLNEFRSNRNHMAVVVDEYAGVAGLVTIEDVLEQIVGDIEDEHDIEDEADLILQRGENEYMIKALLPLEEFNEYFGTGYSDEEVDTLGGLVIQHLGHVARRGEKVQIDQFHIEVMHSDSRRIYLLKVVVDPEWTPGEAPANGS